MNSYNYLPIQITTKALYFNISVFPTENTDSWRHCNRCCVVVLLHVVVVVAVVVVVVVVAVVVVAVVVVVVVDVVPNCRISKLKN